MTREEAILCVKGIKNLGHDMFTKQKDFQECLDMAIKALEQEPCEDCVSRQQAIELVNEVIGGKNELADAIRDGVEAVLSALPPVTPVAYIAKVSFSKEDMQELIDKKMKDIVAERKKGKWINKSHKSTCKITVAVTECSCCGKKIPFNCDEFIYRYCPNCGAEMEEEE